MVRHRKVKTRDEYSNIRLTDIGEHLRFLAQSRTRSDIMHLVDLLEDQCSCEDCQLNKNPECDHLFVGYHDIGRKFVEHVRKELKGD